MEDETRQIVGDAKPWDILPDWEPLVVNAPVYYQNRALAAATPRQATTTPPGAPAAMKTTR